MHPPCTPKQPQSPPCTLHVIRCIPMHSHAFPCTPIRTRCVTMHPQHSPCIPMHSLASPSLPKPPQAPQAPHRSVRRENRRRAHNTRREMLARSRVCRREGEANLQKKQRMILGGCKTLQTSSRHNRSTRGRNAVILGLVFTQMVLPGRLETVARAETDAWGQGLEPQSAFGDANRMCRTTTDGMTAPIGGDPLGPPPLAMFGGGSTGLFLAPPGQGVSRHQAAGCSSRKREQPRG